MFPFMRDDADPLGFMAAATQKSAWLVLDRTELN